MHRNAPLTPRGRRLLCDRIASGRAISHVAVEMGVSRQTASKWWHRFRVEGDAGLEDRSSRPLRSPMRTPWRVEVEILELRTARKWGPARIGMELGVAQGTVWRVLRRYSRNRLAWMDRPTGVTVRRYEKTYPGELVHVDVKKLAKIPPGGGSRFLGYEGLRNNWRTQVWDGTTQRGRLGHTYIHAAVDDYTRIAYVEALNDEKGATAAGFITRAAAWFASIGIDITEVMTDNGPCYKAHAFTAAVTTVGARHHKNPPYQPQINGKVERFNRTLADEWAYLRLYRSEHERRHTLDDWIHHYNHHRNHTAIGGPPISRIA